MANFFLSSNPARQSLLTENLFSEGETELAQSSWDFLATGPLGNAVSLRRLRAKLQTALEVEHSTIPPYLCALYSIKEGKNRVSSEIIKSVVLEEMLHMVMVANLLNAVGGTPKIGHKGRGNFIPSYPSKGLPGGLMPHLRVNLAAFSEKSTRTFIRIEHPAPEGSDQKTIGEFYNALMHDIIKLEQAAQARGKTIFTGKPERQVSAEHYYGAGGKLFEVHNLADAIRVIEEIVGQGEGVFGGNSIFSVGYNENDKSLNLFGADVEEYAHYFRFKEILYGRYYAPSDNAHRDSPNHGLPSGEKFEREWEDVYPMQDNPKMSDYPEGSPLYEKTYAFNVSYMKLLANLDAACNGQQEKLREGIPLMYDLRNKAIELMKIPVGDGSKTAGPSFEYVDISGMV